MLRFSAEVGFNAGSESWVGTTFGSNRLFGKTGSTTSIDRRRELVQPRAVGDRRRQLRIVGRPIGLDAAGVDAEGLVDLGGETRLGRGLRVADRDDPHRVEAVGQVHGGVEGEAALGVGGDDQVRVAQVAAAARPDPQVERPVAAVERVELDGDGHPGRVAGEDVADLADEARAW